MQLVAARLLQLLLLLLRDVLVALVVDTDVLLASLVLPRVVAPDVLLVPWCCKCFRELWSRMRCKSH